MTVVYIGLGSNMDHPQQQVTAALSELACLPDTALLQASHAVFDSGLASGPGNFGEGTPVQSPRPRLAKTTLP